MSVMPLGGNMVTVDREGAAMALLPMWHAARAGCQADGAGMIALLAALSLTPLPVADLRATLTPPATTITWHCTIPALNDSSATWDPYSETVRCRGLRRYAPASDSVTYHERAYFLPIPYVQPYAEDSVRVARGDRLTRSYGAWVTIYRSQHLVTVWLTRTTAYPMSAQYNVGCSRNVMIPIAVYP